MSRQDTLHPGQVPLDEHDPLLFSTLALGNVIYRHPRRSQSIVSVASHTRSPSVQVLSRPQSPPTVPTTVNTEPELPDYELVHSRTPSPGPLFL